MSFFRTGAIYSITYSYWKTNPTHIYIFVLWDAPSINMLHAINIGSSQLDSVQRSKIVNVIKQFINNSAAYTWDGTIIYRILKSYLPNETGKAYRTYFKSAITSWALVNEGWNDENSFTEDERSGNDKLALEANKEAYIKALQDAANRGNTLQKFQNEIAKPIEQQTETTTIEQPKTDTNAVQPVTSVQPIGTTGTTGLTQTTGVAGGNPNTSAKPKMSDLIKGNT